MSRFRDWFGLGTRIEPVHSGDSAAELERARQAKEQAQRLHQEVQLRGARVDRVTGALQTIRVQNHFGEAIEVSMRTRRRGFRA